MGGEGVRPLIATAFPSAHWEEGPGEVVLCDVIRFKIIPFQKMVASWFLEYGRFLTCAEAPHGIDRQQKKDDRDRPGQELSW